VGGEVAVGKRADGYWVQTGQLSKCLFIYQLGYCRSLFIAGDDCYCFDCIVLFFGGLGCCVVDQQLATRVNPIDLVTVTE